MESPAPKGTSITTLLYPKFSEQQRREELRAREQDNSCETVSPGYYKAVTSTKFPVTVAWPTRSKARLVKVPTRMEGTNKTVSMNEELPAVPPC